MKTRIISESINIRINVGNYQHIEIVKQAQEEISYENESDRISLEDNLMNDLINSIVRSMKEIPARLGKGISEAQDVEEAIASSLPKWLDKNPPNIADETKKKLSKVSSEQKENKDKCKNDILSVDGEEKVKNDLKSNDESDIASSKEEADKDFDYFVEKVSESKKSGVNPSELPLGDEEKNESDDSNIFDDEFGIFDF